MLTLQRTIVAAFLTGVAILATVALLAYRGMDRLANASAARERTERVLRQLEETYSRIADAETASRGYVLTGDTTYLRVYGEAIVALPIELRSLRQLAAESPDRRAAMERLEPLVVRRLEAIRTTVGLRATAGVPAAVAHIRTGRGRILMDSVRQLVDEIERAEETFAAAEARTARAGVRRVTATVVIGLTVALAISMLAAAAVHREVDAHARTARAMRQAKEAAEAASRAKSDFLARMSHELRTPLNAIIGFANVMLGPRAVRLGADASRRYLERIRDNGMHLLVLINDLLDTARIEAGRIQVQPETVDVGSLVRELVAGFEMEARERGIALAVEVPPTVGPIDTDPARLRQVLANLVSNALKFTERGEVRVRVATDPSTSAPTRIDVADTGIGIPPERQAAVFDAFEQADSGTERRYGGAGLGLAIARALTELLGFRLEVRSELGAGSTFSVMLAERDGTGIQVVE